MKMHTKIFSHPHSFIYKKISLLVVLFFVSDNLLFSTQIIISNPSSFNRNKEVVTIKRTALENPKSKLFSFMPKAVFLGVFSHYTISKIFDSPPEITAGVVLVDCMPGSMAGYVMPFIAKANFALIVTIEKKLHSTLTSVEV